MGQKLVDQWGAQELNGTSFNSSYGWGITLILVPNTILNMTIASVMPSTQSYEWVSDFYTGNNNSGSYKVYFQLWRNNEHVTSVSTESGKLCRFGYTLICR